MHAISPVLRKTTYVEVRFAEDQPEFDILPAIRNREFGVVTSRWRLSWIERLYALFGGSIWVQQIAVGPPQPIKLLSKEPTEYV